MDRINFTPFIRGLSSYSWINLRSDLCAAVTVALVALPQSMAYALVAGLPPSVGIFAAIFGTIFTASFGYCRHLVSGPTNTVAILLQAAISQVLYAFYREVDPAQQQMLAIHIAVELACIVGCLQILAAATGLGKLAQFVGRPVMKGYIAGAALTIIVSQLFSFSGMASPDASISLYAKLSYFVRNIGTVQGVTLVVGILSLALMLGLKQWKRRFPAAALTFVLAGGVLYFLRVHWPEVTLVRDVGAIGEVYPTVALPYLDFRVLNVLLPIGFAIALLGVIEVTTIVKSVAVKSGQKVSIGQEVFALGLSNVLSSFLGAMPSSGSFSRSRVNVDSGAVTHLSAVVSGVLVAIMVFAMGRAVGYIPLTALSALLFMAASTMVDWSQVGLCLRATRSDAAAFLVTLGACLLLTLDVAFYIGVIISISLYLRKAATPSVREMTVGTRRSFRPRGEQEEVSHPAIKVINVEGELFFGAVDFFQAAMGSLAASEGVRVVVLRLKNAHHLDATTCLALRQLHDHLARVGKALLLCGLTPQVLQVLRRSHLVDRMGADKVFVSDPMDPVGSSRRAFMRAETLCEQPELAEAQGESSLSLRPSSEMTVG